MTSSAPRPPRGYLVHGARSSGSLLLGGEGGLWATDRVELAFTFGNKILLVPRPRTIRTIDLVDAANYFRRPGDEVTGPDEMERKDWDAIRKYWMSKKYDALNFGSMHMDGANDYWIFDARYPRYPADHVPEFGEQLQKWLLTQPEEMRNPLRNRRHNPPGSRSGADSDYRISRQYEGQLSGHCAACGGKLAHITVHGNDNFSTEYDQCKKCKGVSNRQRYLTAAGGPAQQAKNPVQRTAEGYWVVLPRQYRLRGPVRWQLGPFTGQKAYALAGLARGGQAAISGDGKYLQITSQFAFMGTPRIGPFRSALQAGEVLGHLLRSGVAPAPMRQSAKKPINAALHPSTEQAPASLSAQASEAMSALVHLGSTQREARELVGAVARPGDSTQAILQKAFRTAQASSSSATGQGEGQAMRLKHNPLMRLKFKVPARFTTETYQRGAPRFRVVTGMVPESHAQTVLTKIGFERAKRGDVLGTEDVKLETFAKAMELNYSPTAYSNPLAIGPLMETALHGIGMGGGFTAGAAAVGAGMKHLFSTKKNPLLTAHAAQVYGKLRRGHPIFLPETKQEKEAVRELVRAKLAELATAGPFKGYYVLVESGEAKLRKNPPTSLLAPGVMLPSPVQYAGRTLDLPNLMMANPVVALDNNGKYQQFQARCRGQGCNWVSRVYSNAALAVRDAQKHAKEVHHMQAYGRRNPTLYEGEGVKIASLDDAFGIVKGVSKQGGSWLSSGTTLVEVELQDGRKMKVRPGALRPLNPLPRILEVIPARRWRHTSGRTASLYGAVPWTRQSDKQDWAIETVGWTWRNRDGTIGLGRVPAATYDEAVRIMEQINNRNPLPVNLAGVVRQSTGGGRVFGTNPRGLLLKVKAGVPQKMDADDHPSFAEWKSRIDRTLIRYRGLSLDDLEDMPLRDWYDARLRPIRAANRALKHAGAEDF